MKVCGRDVTPLEDRIVIEAKKGAGDAPEKAK